MKDNWKQWFEHELNKPQINELMIRVDEAYQSGHVFPPKEHVFDCFEACDANEVKVVILGQDPYHQYGQANGLSFSVNEGVKLPPSLRNIYAELEDDLGIKRRQGNLMGIAKQGVLFLNAHLTVEEGKAGSHHHLGWEQLTDDVIGYMNTLQPKVFVLWGNDAKKKMHLIDETKHLVIQSAHPSPLSAYRGFFGSKPFSKIQVFLNKQGYPLIDWSEEDV